VVRQRLAICWKSCLRTGRAAAARTSPTHAGEEGDLEAAGGQPGPTKLTGATIMSAQTYSQTELTGAAGAATYSAAAYSFPVALLDQLDLVLAEEAPRSLRRTLRMREGRAETLGVSARNQQSNFGGGKRVRSSREEIKRKRLKCYLSTTMYKTPSISLIAR
jgi:hypothetical protein